MTDDNEQPVEPLGASSLSVKRNALIGWISAAAVAAAAIAGTTVYLVKQAEVSHLREAIHQLKTEKSAAIKQYEDLRLSYSQTIAMQRCEVIDGLDDCLAAGLKRPLRFADADRQLTEARRAQELQRIAAENALAIKPENTKPETKPEPARDARQSAPAPSGKLGMAEFLDELKKIPGVGVDPVQNERPVADKKNKIPR